MALLTRAKIHFSIKLNPLRYKYITRRAGAASRQEVSSKEHKQRNLFVDATPNWRKTTENIYNFIISLIFRLFRLFSYILIFFLLLCHVHMLGGRSWRSGTRCDCKTDWLWVRSPFEEMKYLLKFIFPFLCSGVEVKRGVEFCRSTRNVSRIRQKVGNGVS